MREATNTTAYCYRRAMWRTLRIRRIVFERELGFEWTACSKRKEWIPGERQSCEQTPERRTAVAEVSSYRIAPMGASPVGRGSCPGRVAQQLLDHRKWSSERMGLASVPSEATGPKAPGERLNSKTFIGRFIDSCGYDSLNGETSKPFGYWFLTVRVNVTIELRLLTLVVH